MKFLFFDTETNGTEPMFDRVLELGWVVTDETGDPLRVRSNVLWLNTERVGRVDLHGISPFELRMGKNRKAELQNFVNEVMAVDYIVAHNIEFDLSFVIRELSLVEMYEAAEMLSNKPCFCTREIGRKVIPDHSEHGPSLQRVYNKFFWSEIRNAHSALGDSNACRQVFFHALQYNYFQIGTAV